MPSRLRRAARIALAERAEREQNALNAVHNRFERDPDKLRPYSSRAFLAMLHYTQRQLNYSNRPPDADG